MSKKTNLNTQIQTRKDLKNYCKQLKSMPGFSIGLNMFNSMNGILLHNYGVEDQELHTFKEWKKMGYSIKKGSSAYTIWSKPKEVVKNDPEDDPDESENTDDDEKIETIYFICKLFTKEQVYKR